jgi:transketolase
MRAVHTSAVLHPSDANQTAKLVAEMADRPGISYLRTLRGKTEVRTPPDEPVSIGGSRTLRASDRDEVAVVACGITIPEAEQAAESLGSEGISVRVIDCYSIKPIDADALVRAAAETSGIVTVEDHWPEGGLGDAVLGALAERGGAPPRLKHAVRDKPGSGKPAELMAAAGIDADAIVAAVHKLVRVGTPA